MKTNTRNMCMKLVVTIVVGGEGRYHCCHSIADPRGSMADMKADISQAKLRIKPSCRGSNHSIGTQFADPPPHDLSHTFASIAM